MTPDEAHRILHESAELRKAVQVLADAQREALAVLVSSELDAAMTQARLTPQDIEIRGGPCARTVERMLKAEGDWHVSTLLSALLAAGRRVRVIVEPMPAPRREALTGRDPAA